MKVWALYHGYAGDMRLMGLYESHADGQAEVDQLMEDQKGRARPKGCSLIHTDVIPARAVEGERAPEPSAPEEVPPCNPLLGRGHCCDERRAALERNAARERHIKAVPRD